MMGTITSLSGRLSGRLAYAVKYVKMRQVFLLSMGGVRRSGVSRHLSQIQVLYR